MPKLSAVQTHILTAMHNGTAVTEIEGRYQMVWRPTFDSALFPERFPKTVSIKALLRKGLIYKTGHPVYGEILLISKKGKKHVGN